jgi:hypothetical protein
MGLREDELSGLPKLYKCKVNRIARKFFYNRTQMRCHLSVVVNKCKNNIDRTDVII